MVKTASLYDNFFKTGNYVIYDVINDVISGFAKVVVQQCAIIWVQDGNCKKAWENFSIGAFYNITTKNRTIRSKL